MTIEVFSNLNDSMCANDLGKSGFSDWDGMASARGDGAWLAAAWALRLL